MSFVKSLQEVLDEASFAGYRPHPLPFLDTPRTCPFKRTVRTSEGYPVKVACGKCLYCTLHRSNSWYSRQLCESSVSTGTFFVTLTQDNDHYEELSIEVLQLFFKRLRKSGMQFRYIALGEYGPRTGRAHYHILFFFRSIHGEYEPSRLKQILLSYWRRGFVDVKQPTANHHRYIASYSKRMFMRTRSFKTYSLKPGIGKETPLYIHMFEHFGATGEYLFDGPYGKMIIPDSILLDYRESRKKTLRGHPFLFPGYQEVGFYDERLHSRYLYDLQIAYEKFIKRKL